MKKEKKEALSIKNIVFTIVSLTILVLVLFSNEIFGSDSRIAFIFGVDEGIVNTAINWFDSNLNQMIKAIVNVIIVIYVSKLVRYIVVKLLSFNNRGKTAANLIDNFLRYIAGFTMIIIVLITFGVDTASLFASIGILGLLIGLGAQSLISDVISGLFIVFEGDYRIGDVVVLDGYRGTVEAIGIRTTKIKDVSGNVKIINNSEIKTLINMTLDLSIAIVAVEITYDESIERVENIIHKTMPTIKENIKSIKEGPYYLGVSNFGASGVELKFIAKALESERFQTERDLRRQIKLIFDKNNIDIPFQTVTISNFVEEKSQKLSNYQKEKAKAFVEEQKELSQDVVENLE